MGVREKGSNGVYKKKNMKARVKAAEEGM